MTIMRSLRICLHSQLASGIWIIVLVQTNQMRTMSTNRNNSAHGGAGAVLAHNAARICYNASRCRPAGGWQFSHVAGTFVSSPRCDVERNVDVQRTDDEKGLRHLQVVASGT